jgi:ParB-like chromosome segregation protein Spo0J
MGFDDISADIKENYLALAAGRGVSHEVLADELDARDPHLAAWLRSADAEPDEAAARTAPPKRRRGSAKASTAAAQETEAAKAEAAAERAAQAAPDSPVDAPTPPAEGAES